jgi:hypothetical protein
VSSACCRWEKKAATARNSGALTHNSALIPRVGIGGGLIVTKGRCCGGVVCVGVGVGLWGIRS